MLLYQHVVFFQKVNDADIVFECNLVCLWKSAEIWNICTPCLDSSENVFGQRNGVQFEICLEHEIDYVIESPFPRFFNRRPLVVCQQSSRPKTFEYYRSVMQVWNM